MKWAIVVAGDAQRKAASPVPAMVRGNGIPVSTHRVVAQSHVYSPSIYPHLG